MNINQSASLSTSTNSFLRFNLRNQLLGELTYMWMNRKEEEKKEKEVRKK